MRKTSGIESRCFLYNFDSGGADYAKPACEGYLAQFLSFSKSHRVAKEFRDTIPSFF